VEDSLSRALGQVMPWSRVRGDHQGDDSLDEGIGEICTPRG
jgi:hypothetical protein